MVKNYGKNLSHIIVFSHHHHGWLKMIQWIKFEIICTFKMNFRLFFCVCLRKLNFRIMWYLMAPEKLFSPGAAVYPIKFRRKKLWLEFDEWFDRWPFDNANNEACFISGGNFLKILRRLAKKRLLEGAMLVLLFTNTFMLFSLYVYLNPSASPEASRLFFNQADKNIWRLIHHHSLHVF